MTTEVIADVKNLIKQAVDEQSRKYNWMGVDEACH